jgi:uncharacterized protein with HEPN domain
VSRSVRVLLEDIVEACDIVLEYRAGLSFDEFARHRMPFDAIIRRLMVVGEAASQIPLEQRSRFPEVDWKKIVGLRNVVVHQYAGIDDDIIWDVVQNHIPVLRNEVVSALDTIPDDLANAG